MRREYCMWRIILKYMRQSYDSGTGSKNQLIKLRCIKAYSSFVFHHYSEIDSKNGWASAWSAVARFSGSCWSNWPNRSNNISASAPVSFLINSFRGTWSNGFTFKRYFCSRTIQPISSYRAPKVFLKIGWDSGANIWSLDCMLFEFYYGDDKLLLG